MATSSRASQDPTTGSKPVAITRSADRAADAVWRRLCVGLAAPSRSWLDEIGTLRVPGDDFPASMDIWSVALTAALKNPTRRETASVVLTRLRRLSEETEDPGLD